MSHEPGFWRTAHHRKALLIGARERAERAAKVALRKRWLFSILAALVAVLAVIFLTR